MSVASKMPTPMSVDEFLAWEPGDRRRYELVDGVPRAMAPASRTHGALQIRLGGLIDSHLRARASPCSVVGAPGVRPRVLAEHNFRVPDFAVTCTPYEAEQAKLDDPVLIAEILSPSNHAETWMNVWAYTTIPSVQEILVLRTQTISAQLLRRGADGHWPDTPEAIDAEGMLRLETIDFVATLIDVYATTYLVRARG